MISARRQCYCFRVSRPWTHNPSVGRASGPSSLCASWGMLRFDQTLFILRMLARDIPHTNIDLYDRKLFRGCRHINTAKW